MIKYKGGNGRSEKEAVVIFGANSEFEGVDAEYNYLEDQYEQYELISQEFIDKGDKQYDVLRVKFPGGDVREFWFDISNFYEKDDG